MGLRLSEAKTMITHIEAGLDFFPILRDPAKMPAIMQEGRFVRDNLR